MDSPDRPRAPRSFWEAALVRLSTSPSLAAEPLLDSLVTSLPPGREPDRLLDWARRVGDQIPLPGEDSLTRWDLLASVAAHDLVAARVLEPHLDALAILAEAGASTTLESSSPDSWGVWAAEGPGHRLSASRTGAGWTLSGTKPWCSLAGQVDAGLVTAWVDESTRGLFAVRTSEPGFSADASGWVPSGLAELTTATVTMHRVAARPIGEPGWYLQRPGFAWGGIGVAAVWLGGAVGLARRLAAAVRDRRPDEVALMHLGRVDAGLHAARACLAEAALDVDAGRALGPAGAGLAARVRQVVAEVAEGVLTQVGHALGPGPLSQEHEHVRRVADLGLYLRQHHAERDAVALGRLAGPAS